MVQECQTICTMSHPWKTTSGRMKTSAASTQTKTMTLTIDFETLATDLQSTLLLPTTPIATLTTLLARHRRTTMIASKTTARRATTFVDLDPLILEAADGVGAATASAAREARATAIAAEASTRRAKSPNPARLPNRANPLNREDSCRTIMGK